MIFRKQVFIFFFILLLLISPVMAYAVGIYNVVAYDNSSLGIAAWGANGYNYVMSNPTITIQHVSSLYVWRDPFEYHSLAEVGWVWRKDQGPRFFAAWLKGGVYGDSDLGAATPGTNHYYTIRHVEPTTKWYWYVDGVLKYQLDYEYPFTSGYCLASSERADRNETNYSHFWNLRKRDRYGNWYDWSNLSLKLDNDPDYYLNKVSNTECYMQR